MTKKDKIGRSQNLKNLQTEKLGIQVLKKSIKKFMVPTKEQKQLLYKLANIDFGRYWNAIDGIIYKGNSFDEIISTNDFLFVEIKTTNKKLEKLPYGAFFGISENEEELLKSHKNYRLCIVHVGMQTYSMVDYKEYNALIQNKRITYQVNFKLPHQKTRSKYSL
tara:strand:+ start:21 stop:512 length:492 start_codon:yes stop_codon:yes gene_type:complete